MAGRPISYCINYSHQLLIGMTTKCLFISAFSHGWAPPSSAHETRCTYDLWYLRYNTPEPYVFEFHGAIHITSPCCYNVNGMVVWPSGNDDWHCVNQSSYSTSSRVNINTADCFLVYCQLQFELSFLQTSKQKNMGQTWPCQIVVEIILNYKHKTHMPAHLDLHTAACHVNLQLYPSL